MYRLGLIGFKFCLSMAGIDLWVCVEHPSRNPEKGIAAVVPAGLLFVKFVSSCPTKYV